MKSNLEWKKWGEIDPLYAVATAKGKEKNSPGAWTDEEFYEFGRREWHVLQDHWRQYGVTLGHCVEVGCGAGRMTRQLAGSFERVTALDVSEGQIRYARDHIEAANVEFHLTDGVRIPLDSASADAVFSIYVFQHFESFSDAKSVFQELARVLKQAGTLMIQLPLYEFPDSRLRSTFQRIEKAFEFVSSVKASLNRRLISAGMWRPMMRRLRFERQVLADAMSAFGFVEIEFRNFRGSAAEQYTFVFARRATGSK